VRYRWKFSRIIGNRFEICIEKGGVSTTLKGLVFLLRALIFNKILTTILLDRSDKRTSCQQHIMKSEYYM